jgi:hypothetical protein
LKGLVNLEAIECASGLVECADLKIRGSINRERWEYLPSAEKKHTRLANRISKEYQTPAEKDRAEPLTVFSFRIRLKRFTMMAGVAQGLALMRGYVEVDGGLEGNKTGEALLNDLTESLGRGVDDPGKIAAETLALRSLRDIAHVTYLIMSMGLDFC